MESNFGQTMLQSSLTPSTDVLVSLARLQMLSIKYSRHEFEELNHFVFENITKVDGHASMLRRFAVNYRNMRPNYSKEVEENFWTHIANALERDFDTLSCKFNAMNQIQGVPAISTHFRFQFLTFLISLLKKNLICNFAPNGLT